jgi:ATP-dependent Lon protease
MTLLEHLAQAQASLKVFPLPATVLLPHAVLPLHIFEPRYRQMVAHALEGDRVVAIAQLRPGWEGDYHGRPPMEPLVCAGLILWHETVEDGRFNLLLQGLCRARIEEELPDAPYEGPEEEQLRQAVLELASRLPPVLAEGLLPVAARAQGGALADAVAAALVQEGERRQALLGELDVRARLAAVMGEVGELIVRLAPPSPSEGLLN